MKLNTSFIFLLIFYPFVAYLMNSVLGFEHKKFLLVAFPMIVLFNLLFHGSFIKKGTTAIAFLIFYLCTFIIDFARNEIFYSSYNYFLSALFLIFLDQISISKRTFIRISRSVTIIVIISFLVIVLQGVVNPSFFVPDSWSDRLIENTSFHEQRLPSIFAWISFTATLFTFPPLLSLVVGEKLKSRSYSTIIAYSIIGIVFAILTKGRSTLLYILIILIQNISKSRAKLSMFIRGLLFFIGALVFSFFVLSAFNVPVGDILTYRYLEADETFEQTSAYSRVENLNFFMENFHEFWAFGAGNNISLYYQSEMGRNSNAMIIGILDPIFRYGIFVSFFYYAFLFLVLKRFYSTAKASNNWAMFWGFVGFIAMNFFSNAPHIFQIGIMFLFIYDKYYRTNYLHEKANIRYRILYNDSNRIVLKN